MTPITRLMAFLTILVLAPLFLGGCKPHTFDQVEPTIKFRPYEVIKVREGQWKGYFELVDGQFGSNRQVLTDNNLVIYVNPAEVTQYTFTLFGHPAHPAWLARKVVEMENQVIVDQTGYYAGNKAAFEKIYRNFQIVNETLQADLTLELQRRKAELLNDSGG